ncbi:MAG: NUDIX domain-containing protein [bacterium]|nr:NUDIX domain-containing protein [bacterium]
MGNINQSITHAGAVIFRRKNGIIEVLLTKRVGGKVLGFFFTQGHIEQGEDHEDAARRETTEETGIKEAALLKDLGVLTRKGMKDDGIWYQKTIHFFLFETKEEKPLEWIFDSVSDGKTFQLKFFPFKKAIAKLYFIEEKKLLESLNEKIDFEMKL